MPSKKKKYNARFPAGRIKKIMQSDEEVGKVAQAVPVIISRTLELFVESLLAKTLKITYSRNAKTLSPSHMKQCIMSESRFDFLRELVKNIPDISVAEESSQDNSPGTQLDSAERDQPYDFRMPSTSCEANTSPSSARNGGASSMKNGVQIQGTDVPTASASSCSTPTTDQKFSMKRHWESTQARTTDSKALRRTLSKDNSSDTLDRIEPSSKLMRMDSAPAAVAESSKISKIRLMHQPKSVPCTSKEASYQQPVIPAPIIDINICNKPIVKIDYSNLVLPDKESSSGSSSDHNSMNTYISPVINIDLSKIAAQPNCDLQTVSSMSASTVKSTLELDEDYDNI